MLRAAIFWLSPIALFAAFGAVQNAINGDGLGAAGCGVGALGAGALWGAAVFRVRRGGYRDAVEGRLLR